MNNIDPSQEELAQAEELGVIKKTKDRCGRVVIVMPPQ
jgi:hypothetical protein